MRAAFAADITTAVNRNDGPVVVAFRIPGEPRTVGMVDTCETVNDGRSRTVVMRLRGIRRTYRVSANFHVEIA